MSKFEIGPRPGKDEQSRDESKDLSPVVKKIIAGLESLAEEQNLMAIRALCAGQGKEHGSFHMEGIGFRLLGGPGERLEAMQLQLEVGNKSYNFGSWGNNLEELAEDLVSAGVTIEQLDNYLESVRDISSRVKKQGDQWVITEYGPNNDGVKSFEELMEE